MKIIEKTKEKLIFSDEIDDSLANALRRASNEIPILAIDEIEIFKNDSVLYDEVIAHRMGLIPLVNEKLNFADECSCKEKGCLKCSIQLKLQASGPCTVYSEDLKGKAKVVYDKMPIVLLKEDQEMEIVATARVGRGIEHAKYSPGLVYYRNISEIEINKDCNLCKKCIDKCPYKILKADKKLEGKEVYKCDACDACVEECRIQGKNAITIKPTKEIIFFIESWGQMDAKDILLESIKVLKENLKELEK